ncbi:MAG TPA: ABC transporter permease [Thermoanaerobaculia bacterium]|jgi:predicted permease|nr:ABC transporter permease [Thermoanaerobaculia bacterium]
MLHLRYFARTLVRQPGFALTVILSLALGIGANSAMFAVAKTILLERLAVRDPESLVLLKWTAAEFPAESLSGNVSFGEGGSAESTSFSYPTYEHLARNAKTIASLVAFAGIDRINVSLSGDATIARGAMVSGNYYSALGVNAALGRTLTASDKDGVAMISHAYWRTRFGGARDVVGRTISVNGKPVTIVGVEPRNFSGTLDVGAAPHVIQPMSGADMANGDYWWLSIIGRRAPGATNATIAAETSVLVQQHVRETKIRVDALPGARGLFDMRAELREPVVILAGAVALVLLLACANVAGLSLARAMTRRREIAVRMSLGATRGTLIRQLLTEGVALSLIGGAAGIALAYWIRPLVPVILPTYGAPVDVDIRLDAQVLAFTTLIAVLTGIVFSLVPALRATRVDIAPDARDNSSSPRRNRLANALTIVQIALSIVMLIGCGLFLRSLVNLNAQRPGFDPEHVLTFMIDPTLNGYEGERLANFYGAVDESIRALPRVESSAITQQTLLSGMSSTMTFYVEGRAPSDRREFVMKHTVGTDFLKTMRIPVIAGRGLAAADVEGAPKIALISQALARQYFPNENPIGRRVSASKERPGELEIVGVVADAKYASLRDEMPPTVIVPYAQNEDQVGRMGFVVRAAGDPEELIEAVRTAVRRVDPNVPLFGIATQTDQMANSLRQERALARLSTFFGLMALVLSCIGLYGLMSTIATARTRETGVRIALGARGRDIAIDVLRRSLSLVTVGVIAGVAAALALTRYVRSMVFGVEPNDPLSIVIAVVAMVVVAIAATSIPARRASRIDPIVALRAE